MSKGVLFDISLIFFSMTGRDITGRCHSIIQEKTCFLPVIHRPYQILYSLGKRKGSYAGDRPETLYPYKRKHIQR